MFYTVVRSAGRQAPEGTMQWASAISEQATLEAAFDECATSVLEQLGVGDAPDLVVVFVSPLLAGGGNLPSLLATRFSGAKMLGCTASGVIGAGHEIEGSQALSLTAARLPGVVIKSFHVLANQLPSPDAPPDEWCSLLGVEGDLEPHFLLVADPFTTDATELLYGLDYAYPRAAKIGGLASGGMRPGAQALYLDGRTYNEGVVGIALSGNVIVDTVVAQGCRPIGEPVRITAVQHNHLLKIDDQSPLELLQRLYERLGPQDQALVQRNLFIGIAMDPLLEVSDVHAGDFVIRNVVGVDPNGGSISIGALPREGQIVQFHVRDAESSAQDLRGSLKGYLRNVPGHSGEGALLFSCTGRGQHLYGAPDHDSRVFAESVGDLPLGGFFCAGEIGPVAGTTYLHGYTSSFAIFRPKVAVD